MHERELRAFVSIADTGRMDRAADELGYSQPAISYQIKCLERKVGARLFRRDWDCLRLTNAGQMILPSVRAVLALMDGIRNVSPDTALASPERSAELVGGTPARAVVPGRQRIGVSPPITAAGRGR